MAYYNEFIYEVWFQANPKEEFYLDDNFIDLDEAKEYCLKTTREIETNPNWGYTNFSFDIREVDNPNYDPERVDEDEREDYYFHRDR